MEKYEYTVQGNMSDLIRSVETHLFNIANERVNTKTLGVSNLIVESYHKLPFPYSPCQVSLQVWNQQSAKEDDALWIWEDAETTPKSGHNLLRNQFGGILLMKSKLNPDNIDIVAVITVSNKSSTHAKSTQKIALLQSGHMTKVFQKLSPEYQVGSPSPSVSGRSSVASSAANTPRMSFSESLSRKQSMSGIR